MWKGRLLTASGIGVWLCASGCGARSEVWLDDDDYPSAGAAARAGSGGSVAGRSGASAGGSSGAPALGGSSGAPATCSTDPSQECAPGLICANGLCVPRCDGPADCRAGYVCSGNVCAVRSSTIAAGERHACVAVADGAIYCWGYGISGQLGQGVFSSSETPVRVVGFPRAGVNVRELTAGGSFTCASLSDSTVSCWGSGDLGQLGDRLQKASAVPVQAVIIPPSPAHIAGGVAHGCALTADRRVGCWGANSDGQLGRGTYERTVEFSVLGSLPGTEDMQVTVGGSHSCAFSSAFGVLCWGDNRFWQLGTSEVGDSSPHGHLVAGLAPNGLALLDIAAGGQHTCALLSDHRVRCWGDNTWYQLGRTAPPRSTEPLAVQGIPDGAIYPTQLCSGSRHSCVAMTDGSVRCWGVGGALGNGSATASAAPVKVLGLTEGSQRVTRIACGGTTSCALMDDGSVRCWSAVVGRSLSL